MNLMNLREMDGGGGCGVVVFFFSPHHPISESGFGSRGGAR